MPRVRNLYFPNSEEPFKISRSKIELFTECPRCFYLDRRNGVSRPPGFPFTLNSAVDTLLKKEFDIHRAQKTAHPLMKAYGLSAVPFQHEMIDEWRENFKGIQYLHRPTNLVITGAIDDVWVGDDKKLIIVDYKATSTSAEITLEADYRAGYKRQMEIYQWLFRRVGFAVSDTGYFVYANGNKENKSFDGKLEFDVKLIPHVGNDDWVEKSIIALKKCLDGSLPPASEKCEYCAYRKEALSFEK